MIRQEIIAYVEQNILPLYDHFDRGHRRDHACQVIERSAQLARGFDVDEEMVYVVAEADRLIIPELIVRRTVQYSLANFPSLDYEGHWHRSLQHLEEKYAEGGYLRLWIEGSDNEVQLQALRGIIADRESLRALYDRIFEEERNKKEKL